jgi:hypothetical protein
LPRNKYLYENRLLTNKGICSIRKAKGKTLRAKIKRAVINYRKGTYEVGFINSWYPGTRKD